MLLNYHTDTFTAEDEKKLIASLLGKLYISPGSTPSLLRETYSLVNAAVEDSLLTDTTSRNALYKLHASVGRIVISLDGAVEPSAAAAVGIAQLQGHRRGARSVSVVSIQSQDGGRVEDRLQGIQEDDGEASDGTVTQEKRNIDMGSDEEL